MATFLNESNFNGKNGSYFKLILEYDKVMHTDTNSHDVTYYLYFQSLSGYSGSGSANSVKGQINGVQVGTTNSIGVNQKKLIGQKTVNVPHNEDGTGSALYSALIDTTWTLGDASVTGKLTLPTIKRASTWNMTNLQMSNIEDTLVLKINKYVTGYTDKVVISSADGKTVVKTINNASNNQQITFTSEELTKLYTLDSNETLTNLKFLMTLSTYDGNGNIVGDAQKITMSAYLLNANPTFTYTIVETEAKVIDLLDKSDASTIIKSVSKPKITVTASALKGASIKTISIVNGTQANANANPYTFNNVQTGTFTIVVTDSRNLTRTQVVTKNLINYTPVYINSYSFERESQTSSKILLNADITCYSGSFNSITNIPTVMYKMGASGTYQEITSGFTFSNNKIIFNNYSLGEILPYTQTNRFYLYVLDLLTEDTENEIVSKGVSTFEAGEHDFQVNGTLYLADENRENKRAINLSGEVSKNLLNISSFETKTLNGVTFTNNGNGSITINGTASTGFGVNFVKLVLKKGTYHLSLNATTPTDFYIYDYDTNTNILNKETTSTLTKDYENIGFDTWINQGITFNNITIYPQIEVGDIATSFEPYKEKKIYGKGENGSYQEFLNVERTNNQQNYSTYEQAIGTWIDGKPLYRKTIKVTSPTQTSSSAIILILDSNCVIQNFDGYLETNVKARYKLNCWFSTSDYIYTFINENQYSIKSRVSLDAYANKTITITVEYTKNTD